MSDARSCLHSLVLTIAAVLAWPSAGAEPAATICVDPVAEDDGPLSADACESLRLAAEVGATEITVVAAVDPSRFAALTMQVRRGGGTILKSDARVGYLRARLPVGALPAVLATRGLVALEPLRISVRSTPGDPPGTPAPASQQPSTTDPDASTGPYFPQVEAGIAELLRANPTYDGRGTVIAIIDSAVDLLNPELQTAYDGDGRPVPKVIDVLTGSDPAEGGGRWINFRTELDGTAAVANWNGQRYRLPSPGRYRIAALADPETVAFIRRRSRTAEADSTSARSATIGLLWDRQQSLAWVDTDLDLDFADERPMRDYSNGRGIGLFGTREDPAGRIPFTIQIDPDAEAIHVAIARDASHGTMVATSAAGNRGDRGRFDGAAPGAQLLVVTSGSDIDGLIEAMLLAAADHRVDIVNCSCALFPRGMGRSISRVAQHVFSRLAEAYGKPVTAAASYAGPGVFTTGMYVSRAMAERNLRLFGEADHSLVPQRWPSATDGQLVPAFYAPSNGLAGDSGVLPAFDPFDRSRRLNLPAGYQIGHGQSQAAPTLAGAIATLISAARQANVPADLERIRLALRSGARWVEGASGWAPVVDAAAAWRALRALNGRDVPRLATRAPIERTGARPRFGTGLFVDSWPAATRGRRRVALSLAGVAPSTRDLSLSWIGNDGSFSAPRRLVLGRDGRGTLDIEIAPRGRGLHSAVLQISDPQTGLVLADLSSTVIVPDWEPRDACRTDPTSVRSFQLSPRDRQLLNVAAAPGQPLALEFAASGADVQFWVTPPNGRIILLSRPPAENSAPAVSGLDWQVERDPASQVVAVRLAPTLPGLWRFVATRRGYLRLDPPESRLTDSDRVAVRATIGVQPGSRCATPIGKSRSLIGQPGSKVLDGLPTRTNRN